MINCTGVVYANNEIGLLWLIKLSVVYDEDNNVIGRRDVVYIENDIEL